MIVRIAIVLLSGSCLNAVQALCVHRQAMEPASLPLLLLQWQVIWLMKLNASHGDVDPCKKVSHHACGMGNSFGIEICRPHKELGTSRALLLAMVWSDAKVPVNVSKSVSKLWVMMRRGS